MSLASFMLAAVLITPIQSPSAGEAGIGNDTQMEITPVAKGDIVPFDGMLFPVPLAEQCAQLVIDNERCVMDLKLKQEEMKQKEAKIKDLLQREETARGEWRGSFWLPFAIGLATGTVGAFSLLLLR